MKTVFATLIAALLISPAFANEDNRDQKDYGEKFNELDADNSGTLSRSEVQSVGIDSEAFDRADQDGDGVLNEAEFRTLKKDDKNRDRSEGNT